MAERCRRCKYHDLFCNAADSLHCEYSLIMGKTRTSLLKPEEMPGEVCPLFEEGEKINEVKQPVIFDKLDVPTIKKYVAQGLTVKQIAVKMETSEYKIYKVCRENDLHPVRPKVQPNYSLDWAKVRELYDQGLNDSQISKVCCCSDTVIGSWRRKNNLPTNYRRKK